MAPPAPTGLSTTTKYYAPKGWTNKPNAKRRVDVFWDALEPPTKRPKKHADPKSSVSAPLAVGNPNVATDMSLSSPPVPTRASQLPRAAPCETSTAGATDEGVFLEPGDDEDFCIEDDVGDDETCDDKSVADENDEEIDSDSEAKVVTPDPILEEPNTDEATYSSSQDISKADLRLHTLKGCDDHMEDSSKYCLFDTE
ncbi:hypothetical protein PI126_g7916 [Phytophthora idaei]|nr:hypothetical protein PI126_g7916 [Phytophthora idaei]